MSCEDEALIDEFDGQTSGLYPSFPSLALNSKITSFPSLPQSENIINNKKIREWKEVLFQAGFPIEFAWKNAVLLNTQGIDANVALNCTVDDFAKLLPDVSKPELLSLVRTIDTLVKNAQQHEGHNDNIEEIQANNSIVQWIELFRPISGNWGGTTMSLRYATLIASQNWESTSDMTYESLLKAGITNELHREVILQLVEREFAKKEYESNFHLVSEKELTEKKNLQRELIRNVEALDAFQDRLTQILSGNTEKQKASRLKREEDREARKLERQIRRGK
jgi:hypothetical protein